MADLVVIVPSRGRPAAAAELIAAFTATSTADTTLAFAVDDTDDTFDQYVHAARSSDSVGMSCVVRPPSTMVNALNDTACGVTTWADPVPFAVAFLGDDHRPRTHGWDAKYLETLRDLGTGIVYGNDLLQCERLPTQCAMTSDIVQTLGYMAPPTLMHLMVDNWWHALGAGAGCIRYLPDVVVEHLHPVAGKAQWDDGYRRVNDPAMYERDQAEYARIARDDLPADIQAVRALRTVRA